MALQSFSAKIRIIGVNPYVLLPAAVLKSIFAEAGKSRGPVPVRVTINGNPFTQTLVKFAGKWRLYLNTPMRRAAGIDTGDTAHVTIAFDPEIRTVAFHPELRRALDRNKKANAAFQSLPPSRQKEIVRYIGFLKSEESVKRNVAIAVQHLLGKARFVGREKA